MGNGGHIQITDHHTVAVRLNGGAVVRSKQGGEFLNQSVLIGAEILQNTQLQILALVAQLLHHLRNVGGLIRKALHPQHIRQGIINNPDDAHQEHHLEKHRSAAHLHGIVALAGVQILGLLLELHPVLRIRVLLLQLRQLGLQAGGLGHGLLLVDVKGQQDHSGHHRKDDDGHEILIVQQIHQEPHAHTEQPIKRLKKAHARGRRSDS